MPLSEETRQHIEDVIHKHDVVLFMKGTRSFPQCGFSNRVVSILDGLVPDYATVDVLADPEIRDGIKEFSSWPTVPQLYVRGEFVGGCDIVTEMFGSGELFEKLGLPVPERRTPTLHVTSAAASELQSHLDRAPGQAVHLSIDARRMPALGLGPRQGSEIAVDASGVTVLMDPITAQRAEGTTIDFNAERGFSIDIPGAGA